MELVAKADKCTAWSGGGRNRSSQPVACGCGGLPPLCSIRMDCLHVA